jgi:hypothetical protein
MEALMFVPPISMAKVNGKDAAAAGSGAERSAMGVDIRNDLSLCCEALGAGLVRKRRTRPSRSTTLARTASVYSRRVPLLADLGCLDNLLPCALDPLVSAGAAAVPAALPVIAAGSQAARDRL